jgi:hypothetical protein
MTEVELNDLAENWIAFWKATEDSQERTNLYWVMDREYDLMQDEPEQVWQLILAVLKRSDSNEIQEVLSAGPLEDLLAKHGDAIIESVEAEAKLNPMFAKLLGGVWKSSMTDEIWNRVQDVWDRRGWDGIPETAT